MKRGCLYRKSVVWTTLVIVTLVDSPNKSSLGILEEFKSFKAKLLSGAISGTEFNIQFHISKWVQKIFNWLVTTWLILQLLRAILPKYIIRLGPSWMMATNWLSLYFVGSNNYYQFGYSHWVFDINVRKDDIGNFGVTDAIILVNNTFGSIFREAAVNLFGGYNIERVKHLGRVSTIVRLLTSAQDAIDLLF